MEMEPEPAAEPATERAEPVGAPDGLGAGTGDDADWVNSPVDEDVDDELAASAAEDSRAEDWINGPSDEEDEVSGAAEGMGPGTGAGDPDWVNGPIDEGGDDELTSSAAEDSQAEDWINGPDDTDTTVRPPLGSEPAAADPMAVTEVSVPALEGSDEILVDGGTPSDDPGDHRGQPWSTEFGALPSEQPEQPEQPEPADEEPAATENPGPIEHSDGAPLLDDSAGTDEGNEDVASEPDAEPDAEPEAEPSGERRISSFEEVHDGGFGIGSAAPLEDRAQPLGDAVKAWRESSTFRSPGSTGYDDDEPDAWFFNEEAARRAGFGPAGE